MKEVHRVGLKEVLKKMRDVCACVEKNKQINV
jgi:hypothetical protein